MLLEKPVPRPEKLNYLGTGKVLVRFVGPIGLLDIVMMVIFTTHIFKALFMCIRVHLCDVGAHVCRCHLRPEEGIRFPGIGVTLCWYSRSGPLGESPSLLTTEWFLHPYSRRISIVSCCANMQSYFPCFIFLSPFPMYHFYIAEVTHITRCSLL